MTIRIRRNFGASSARSVRAVVVLVSLALGGAALLAPVSDAQAAFRQIPNGRIAIDLAATFTPSETFPGFVDKTTGASFAVFELPAAVYERIKTIPDTPEGLANEGFGGTEKTELKGRDGTFIYLVGKQTTSAGDATKFVLMFVQNDVTGVIVGNVPQTAIDAGTYTREGIEAILAKVAVRDKPADPKDITRFGYLGPFKEAFDDGGLTKAYNISGAKPSASGANQVIRESMLLVSSSIHGDAIDPKTEADKVFNELGGMKDRQIEDSKEVTIAELRGHQITGLATDTVTGSPIALRLVVLSGQPFGYFMFLGSTPLAEKDKMMPEIEKVIASFELAK